MSVVLRFHIWLIMIIYYKMWQILLQNTISSFNTKCDRSLLQNAPGFLLQNATVVLQNATVITNWDGFITKCDAYCKLRQYTLISWIQRLSVYLKKILITRNLSEELLNQKHSITTYLKELNWKPKNWNNFFYRISYLFVSERVKRTEW